MTSKLITNLLIVLVLNVITSLVYGHVALTFPPARKYDLDFLDSSRTPGPCGMPKGKNIWFISVIFYVQYTFLTVNKI